MRFLLKLVEYLEPLKSSLTCKWKTTLEKHVGPVLPVKLSLGDLSLPLFCTFFWNCACFTEAGIWKAGKGYWAMWDLPSYKCPIAVVYCFVCSGPSEFIEWENWDLGERANGDWFSSTVIPWYLQGIGSRTRVVTKILDAQVLYIKLLFYI